MALARDWIPVSLRTRNKAEESSDAPIFGATLRLPCMPIPSHSTRDGQSYVSNHCGRTTCGMPPLENGSQRYTFLVNCETNKNLLARFKKRVCTAVVHIGNYMPAFQERYNLRLDPRDHSHFIRVNQWSENGFNSG